MNKIKPNALYWAPFNHFEMRIPGQAVLDCAHSGDCEADIRRWAPLIRQQVEADNFPNKPDPDKIRKELEEYGAWDETELAVDEMNWIRLVWAAANSIRDEEKPNCSKPVKTKAEPLYSFTVPPTSEMGSYSGVCSGTNSTTARCVSFRADALWSYNHARAHDGLEPLNRMPAGTTYTRQN